MQKNIYLENGNLTFTNLSDEEKVALVRFQGKRLHDAGDFENARNCDMAVKQIAAAE